MKRGLDHYSSLSMIIAWIRRWIGCWRADFGAGWVSIKSQSDSDLKRWKLFFFFSSFFTSSKLSERRIFLPCWWIVFKKITQCPIPSFQQRKKISTGVSSCLIMWPAPCEALNFDLTAALLHVSPSDCKFNCHKRCAVKVPNNCLGEVSKNGGKF